MIKLFNIIKDNIKRFNWATVFLGVNLGILVVIMFFYATITYTVIDLQRQTILHRYVWEQEIRSLNIFWAKVTETVIENDKEQLGVDKRQQRQIENSVRKEEVITNNINKLTEQRMQMIDKLEKTKKIDLENIEDIKRSNFVVYNATAGFDGSGSHIKIGENYYVLTCAHLTVDEEDYMWAIDNRGTMRPLELIKIDMKKDLAIYKILTSENIPYLEISKVMPKEGSEVIVIGNPDGMEDIVTDGIVSKITKDHVIFTNIVFFGSSGGAVLYEGKIIGVSDLLLFMNLGRGIKLEVIQEFLKGIGE